MPPRLYRIAHLVVVFALVASTQGFLFVQASWQVNQEWIAETLCVNRARPELHCNGTCQLSTLLKQQEEREKENQSARLDLALSVTAHVAESIVVPKAPLAVGQAWRVGPVSDTGIEDVTGVFHPPRVARAV